MLDFIHGHLEFFRFLGIILYALVLFGMIFVGVGMVYLHHVRRWPRLLAVLVSFPPAVPLLVCAVAFLDGVGAVASPITAVLLFLLGMFLWVIAVLFARQRFAPFAAADFAFRTGI